MIYQPICTQLQFCILYTTTQYLISSRECIFVLICSRTKNSVLVIRPSPSTVEITFYKNKLKQNFDAYKDALQGLDSAFIGYAVKSNHNLHLMRYLASLGCGAVLVSGNELRTAI